jgi:hypothetical protein
VYHTHQYQKQNYMLDLGSYVLATKKNISCNAYITRARRKKKPEAQIQPASLHKLCIFLPLLFKKNSNERPELKISKRISFFFSRLLLSIKNRRGFSGA